MKSTSCIFVLYGREIQIEFAGDGQFGELDPLQYASVMIPSRRPPAAFRVVDVTDASLDVVSFPLPIGSQCGEPESPSKTDGQELPQILSISPKS